VSNSIVAGNTATAGAEVNRAAGTFTSGGNNLFGQNGNAGLVNVTAIASDLILSGAISTAILPLGDYGGTTKTHALTPGSAAIDAGNNASAPATDQRGAARIVGGTIDIGAYESAGFSLTPTGTPQSTQINTAFSTPLSVQLTDNAFNKPLAFAGLSVTFTAPSSGASGTFGSGTTVTTNAAGIAINPFTANNMAGSFAVSASATGITGATFNLTNTLPPSPPTVSTKFQPNSEIARATQRQYAPPTASQTMNSSTSDVLGCSSGDTSALGNAVGSAIPAVAAMMNSGGGSISVSMGGAFPSCGDGLAALPGNQSQLAEYLDRQVQEKIGREYRHLVHISFSNSPGKAMAIIQVDKAWKPAFLNQEGKQMFYIRDGEGQRILSPTEQEEYIRKNWEF
jgi:hypothetical protein